MRVKKTFAVLYAVLAVLAAGSLPFTWDSLAADVRVVLSYVPIFSLGVVWLLLGRRPARFAWLPVFVVSAVSTLALGTAASVSSERWAALIYAMSAAGCACTAVAGVTWLRRRE